MSEAQQTAQEIERLLGAGAIKPALRAAKSARRTHPRNAFFANLLGVAHSRAGDASRAIREFRQAARLRPGYFEPRRNLAALLIQSGRAGEALRILKPIADAAASPGADALRLLALAQIQIGDARAAEESADHCLALRPDDPDMLNLRGVARVGQMRFAQALGDYEAALALRPDMADALANMAHPLLMIGREDEALAALERALSLQPDHVNALHRYGVQLIQLGRLDEARKAFARLIEIQPANAEALREMTGLIDRDTAPAILQLVERVKAASRPGDLERAQLGFAEYRLRNLLGMKRAEEALIKANALTRKQRSWNVDAAARGAVAIIEGLPRLPAPAAPVTTSGVRPVFILGLPRSGTTLTEQVLTAHPQVRGLGEFTAAELWMQRHGPTNPFTTEDGADLARSYRNALPELPASTTRVTDKLPGNFRMIGQILTAFPDAVILHTRRDPLDVGWSLWRNWFANPGLNFAFDQRAMAGYFNIYARLMRHWRAIAGDRIHDLDYDALVGDIEATSRRMARLVGLDWRPAMARPDQNMTPVRTASQTEVRAPVHAGSIGLGRRNAAHLAQFIEGLDPDLWGEGPSAALRPRPLARST